MKLRTIVISALALLLTACSTPSKYKVVAYYPSFGRDGRPLSEAVLSRITHVNLSFAKVEADGSIHDEDVRASMLSIGHSAQKAGVKVLVSVGGGGGHTSQVNFASAIHDADARKALIDNLMTMADEMGLDGLDIDYEAWGISEVAPDDVLEGDLQAFLTGLRSRLGKRLLTAAVADYGRYNAAMAEAFDYVTVMAYDLTGPWTTDAGPHSPYTFFVSAIEKVEASGFPKSKIVGGVPFYGRGYPGGDTKKAYEMSYAQIVDTYPGAEDRDSVNDELWYDGFPAIDRKCSYIVDNKLGGIMFWQVAGDSADPGKSLLYRISKDLR